jgi:hypothetical protein
MDTSTEQTDDFIERSRTAVPRQLSYELEEQDDWRTVLNHPALTATLRLMKMVVQGVVLFAVGFIEIIAEVLAPIVSICGIAWAVLPGVLANMGPEGPARDMINSVVQAVPKELHVGHSVITASSLILYGLVLIAVVALCRTMLAIVNREV